MPTGLILMKWDERIATEILFGYPEDDDFESAGIFVDSNKRIIILCSYEIEYIAGYGSSSDDVPEAIKLGMTMWVADIYENRVPISEPPGIVKTIMAPFRIIPV